jgi:hypothetical protein
MSQRVIVKETVAGVGITYIPINRYAQGLTVQCTPNGAATFTVDYTLDNVIRGAANPYDTSEGLVAPASAVWSNLIASGAVAVAFNGTLSAYCLRINQTVGAGNVSVRISQTSETL